MYTIWFDSKIVLLYNKVNTARVMRQFKNKLMIRS